MAASVIRTLSGFGSSCSLFIPVDEDDVDEDCEEEEDGVEEEEDDSSCSSDPSSSDPYGEMTERLLRFAELISGDVRRYFGRSRESDACDVYAGRAGHEVGGRQRRYSDTQRATWWERRDQPESLGPLAELFQSAEVKKQGLPMIQRRLPRSFWTEPRPEHLHASANVPHLLTCSTETTNINCSVPEISSCSSSSTPDFSDLLEHWTSDRDTYSCEYQLS